MMAGLSNAECWYEKGRYERAKGEECKNARPQTHRPFFLGLTTTPQARNATHRHDSPLSHFNLAGPLGEATGPRLAVWLMRAQLLKARSFFRHGRVRYSFAWKQRGKDETQEPSAEIPAACRTIGKRHNTGFFGCLRRFSALPLVQV